MNSTIAETTTRTPRIVGYQMPWAVAARIEVTALLLQRPLVGHDLLDLVLGEDRAEVRHAARRDPADPVLLVGVHPDADPLEQLVLAGRRRELVVDVAPGEVRPV